MPLVNTLQGIAGINDQFGMGYNQVIIKIAVVCHDNGTIDLR